MKPEVVALKRAKDKPVLAWIAKLGLNPKRRYKIVLEQPDGSKMLTSSPIPRLGHNSLFSIYKVMQCAHGAVNELKEAIKKPTILLSDIILEN